MNEMISETTEVRIQHRFDIQKMENFMREHINGFSGNLTVRQFKYGQSNPTFLMQDDKHKYVMRKKPPGKLLPSAHAVDREYRIITALQDTDVPLAKTYALCEDSAVIGTGFYIMELVEGRVFRDAIASQASNAEERAAIFDSMNETLANIHRVDWEDLGLGDYGKPGNYMARQVGRWTKQYVASKTHDIKSMNNLIRWLPENIPADDSTTIAHGDFRLENLIIHPIEPRVVAVLDWELSTLGHPLADLAYNCIGYHFPSTDVLGYGYGDKNLSALGVPVEEDYLAAYCRRTGRNEISDWEFFLAFGMFRLAAIVQGVYKRGLDGIASSENAEIYGEMVPYLSEVAWRIVAGVRT